jgi:uncharacterized membrane protein YeaQ/YmgE (transglycosylase-associated protein family)
VFEIELLDDETGEPIGFLPTLSIGIIGSFMGGIINYFVFGQNYGPAGFFMSVVGAIVFCSLLRWYSFKNAE